MSVEAQNKISIYCFIYYWKFSFDIGWCSMRRVTFWKLRIVFSILFTKLCYKENFHSALKLFNAVLNIFLNLYNCVLFLAFSLCYKENFHSAMKLFNTVLKICLNLYNCVLFWAFFLVSFTIKKIFILQWNFSMLY